MEKTLNNRKAQKKAKAKLMMLVLSLVLMAMFSVGCEEMQRAGPAGGSAKIAANAGIDELTAHAYRIIQQGLNDSDPAIRVIAIEVVAETRPIKLIPKVQRLLGDEYTPVRFAAALAIGDLQYTFGAKPVKQLFRDPDPNVKIAACYAMVKLGDKRYLEVLRSAIRSKDQTLRANSAFLLGKSNDTDALKLLWWAMREPNSADKVTFQAAESIAMLGDDRIYPRLWTMLLSTAADLRVTGVRAMGALRTLEARDALIGMLDDKVLEVRLAAAEQLGRLGEPMGEPEVLDVFQKRLTAGREAKARARINVLTALAIGRIATPQLTRHLPGLLNNESKAVRIAAAKAVLQSRIRY